jgi:hypothetical protein
VTIKLNTTSGTFSEPTTHGILALKKTLEFHNISDLGISDKVYRTVMKIQSKLFSFCCMHLGGATSKLTWAYLAKAFCCPVCWSVLLSRRMAVAVATVCLGFRSTLTFHCSVLASAPSSRNPLFTLALRQIKKVSHYGHLSGMKELCGQHNSNTQCEINKDV